MADYDMSVAARCFFGLRARPVAGHDARIALVER
jgi:hypothetical protein